jgi:preprotein translocase subunit Sec61beta
VAYFLPIFLFSKMANDRITMPTSTAGITRYFDDYKSKIEFKPGHIIVLTILVIIVIILLHIYGKSLLGA